MATTDTPKPPMGKGPAVIATLIVVLVIFGFIELGKVLGLTPLYAGFLVLWYFAGIDALEPKALPPLAVGGACGAATAWALQLAVGSGNGWAIIGVLVGIVVAIWLQIVHWLPIVFNRAYMLYVTVLAAPVLQANEKFPDVLLVIAVATVYFGGIGLIVRRALIHMRR